jgi:hypothetical protein
VIVRARLLTVTTAVALGASLAIAPLTSYVAPAAASARSGQVNATVFTEQLNVVGQVNLGQLAASAHHTKVATHPQGARISRSAAAASHFHAVDNALISRRPKGKPTGMPHVASTPLTNQNVPGTIGFAALTNVLQAQTNGGFDLEPPDQGLCAGNGYVMEFINNALAIYDKNGNQLVAPIGSADAFLQPTTSFFSDPRCYYDAPTRRWFYQEFTVGGTTASGKVIPSVQYEAVSNTPDPTGSYSIYSWDTTDAGGPHCPCFGDYDNLGADANGIYVATDEFPDAGPGYNGVVLYGIAKGEIETVNQTGIIPPVVGFRIHSDPFGQPEIIAPASTPAGGRFAPNTEYFVESNPDQISDNHLLVYAMTNTANLTLFTSGPPTLLRTEVTTQKYAFPPDAVQKPGPRPLGRAFQAPAGDLQADFDAEMEPTFTNGHLYAELASATSNSTSTSAADWFIFKPTVSGNTVSAPLVHQGSVQVNGVGLLYPFSALNAKGNGFLLFSLSGHNNYPSPAYIAYNGTTGPHGPVRIATPGTAPEDGFTCYAAFVGPNYGGCRWGDYSDGVAMNGRIYMATEMIPPTYRDEISNWGTYVWSAPAP